MTQIRMQGWKRHCYIAATIRNTSAAQQQSTRQNPTPNYGENYLELSQNYIENYLQPTLNSYTQTSEYENPKHRLH
jgi:hypothetical protein